MKIFLAAATLAIFGATSAFAADLPARPYTKAPPMVSSPAYNWSGIYVGGQVGGAWTKYDGAFVFPPPATFGSRDVSNGIGGGFIGAQYQWSSIVLGVEGSISALFDSKFNGSGCIPPAACLAGSTQTARFDDPIWTFGGRLGFAAGAFPIAGAQWMPYVTGGWAATKVDQRFATAAGVLLSGADNQKLKGYYIGGGIDWAFNQNWIFGLEYRHHKFDQITVLPFSAAGVPAVADSVVMNAKMDTFMARLSYKFNWAQPAVVAKY